MIDCVLLLHPIGVGAIEIREHGRHFKVDEFVHHGEFNVFKHGVKGYLVVGGIENANGRLRRDLPRNTGLDGYTDADITDVVWNLNSTPRKCLGYQTPIEAFAANLGVALEL